MSKKHMSIENRETILEGLNNNLSFTCISKLISKDRTTISKEIKKHRILHESKDHLRKKCANLNSCSITGLCPYVNCHNKLCKTCNQCSSICPDFKLDICERLVKPPYVCNGCPTRTNCHKPIKYFYKPSSAQHEYENVLSSSREGISLSPIQLKSLDDLVSPLILENGQHLNHIYINHENEIPISMRTIYDYISKGYLHCKNIDLPKKVSYKARKSYSKGKMNSSKSHINHTYNDYLAYMKQYPDSHVVQIDTVEGLKGEPLLLTMHAVKENFQIAHLIKNKESQNIMMIFDLYQERFNDDELFVRFFDVILTDNGPEFSDILSLEKMGIHVFFCDPNRPDQKGACERNHEYIRYYLPKGHSFANLHMKDVWIMMSHINSISRKNLNKKCPYQVMEYIWGKAILEAFHIFYVSPEKVIFDNRVFNKQK